MITAASKNLALCGTCSKLSPVKQRHCPRCGARLHIRKPNSIARVLAHLVTATILYIPANVLPITVTYQLGDEIKSTIIGGVILLWQHDSYLIATIIFVASIVVPAAKIIAMYWLCWNVVFHRNRSQEENTKLYRVVELVGRWSMIDVFVVTILVALIHLSNILVIQPGSAALAFACVVIISMFAAFAFDPRLIWDRANQTDTTNE